MTYNTAHPRIRRLIDRKIERLRITDFAVSVMDGADAMAGFYADKGMNPGPAAFEITADRVLTVDGKPLRRVGPKVYP